MILQVGYCEEIDTIPYRASNGCWEFRGTRSNSHTIDAPLNDVELILRGSIFVLEADISAGDSLFRFSCTIWGPSLCGGCGCTTRD